MCISYFYALEVPLWTISSD